MSRASTVVLTSLTVVALLAQPLESTADPIPIQITGGGLSITQGGSLSLIGEDFNFSGSVGVIGGVFGPFVTCLPCLPGAPVSLTAHWIGNDLHGTVIFQGTTYERVGDLVPGHAVGSVTFSGTVDAPQTAGLTGVATAPFSFEGRFTFPQTGEVPAGSAALFGSGTAAVEFHRSSADLPWSYRSAVYQFDDVDPVPEPGTMILVGTVMAGMALRRRRARRGNSRR